MGGLKEENKRLRRLLEKASIQLKEASDFSSSSSASSILSNPFAVFPL